MNRVLVDRLTEAQREVLRLVGAAYNSKEIGRIIGRSPHSIDRRVERAMRVLGVDTRQAAARMLLEAEGNTYEEVTRESLHLATSGDSVMLTKSDTTMPGPENVEGSDEATPTSSSPPPRFVWPLPGRSEDHIDLDLKARLAWALVGIPVVVMLAWGLLLAGIGALDTLKV